ncbi:MAG: alpha/beta hydrolase, partial [Candidatus Nealsonbacteria bacterium CG10_big_fil_rev_8_21_14_0_10_36_24]
MIINGLKINYKIIGEGRPFLILHGWGSNFEKWQKVGELLVEKNLKVIIPDLPGFGESQKPTIAWNLDDYCNFVEEFVKILNLDKFFLL